MFFFRLPPCGNVLVRLVVPAASARPGAPLAPVLGQHQIKVADFVAEFNRVTAGYTPGVPLGVRVTRPGGKLALRVGPPTWSTLVGGPLPREDLWFLVGYRFGRVTPGAVRTALGTLRSLGCPVR